MLLKMQVYKSKHLTPLDLLPPRMRKGQMGRLYNEIQLGHVILSSVSHDLVGAGQAKLYICVPGVQKNNALWGENAPNSGKFSVPVESYASVSQKMDNFYNSCISSHNGHGVGLFHSQLL